MKKLNKNSIYILITILIIGSAIASTLLIKKPYGTILGLGLAIVPIVIILMTRKPRNKTNSLQNLNNFITVFTYFKIYILNGMNVYDSLLSIRKYADPWILEQLDILINEIDEDKTVMPFVNFSKKFQNPIVEEIMITIYQMIDQGTDYNYINSFTYIFDEFKKANEANNLKKIENGFVNKTNLCLIGSGLFTFAIMIGVISMLGASLNGI